ncbi:strictosidine synthase [Pseudarthrobacter sulfonivorans]|uniref:strictosidine synthase n=1 Tax=Pseudarthrobacter sulfonivorans TaxID=121292 RepID=UPI00285BBEA9|nr:strictosidine synthase [Pseudarthrobacter sulfonivorans]MDR6416882.1 hypothetical protein [Pseudarthrobacter sulfonivorans]
MGTPPATTQPQATKHFTSSVLLWVRNGQPRQSGMDYWKGPHSGIISATPGLEEYRQIHLAEHNPGLWPATTGVETTIPVDRKIDGIAEVTFQSALSPLKGRKQTALAYKDEINVFRRTLLYAGPPNTARWFDVASPAETVGARAIIYLRRRHGVRPGTFRRTVTKRLVPALVITGVLKDPEDVGHSPCSPRQPGGPQIPRIDHPGIRRPRSPRCLLRQSCRPHPPISWPPLSPPSTPMRLKQH